MVTGFSYNKKQVQKTVASSSSSIDDSGSSKLSRKGGAGSRSGSKKPQKAVAKMGSFDFEQRNTTIPQHRIVVSQMQSFLNQ